MHIDRPSEWYAFPCNLIIGTITRFGALTVRSVDRGYSIKDHRLFSTMAHIHTAAAPSLRESAQMWRYKNAYVNEINFGRPESLGLPRLTQNPTDVSLQSATALKSWWELFLNRPSTGTRGALKIHHPQDEKELGLPSPYAFSRRHPAEKRSVSEISFRLVAITKISRPVQSHRLTRCWLKHLRAWVYLMHPLLWNYSKWRLELNISV